LLLLLALLQLGWCDLTRRLLPRGMVHVTTALVAGSAAVVAGVFGDWPRLEQAVVGGAALFGLLFAFNLMNPAWIAFGDVRLAFVAGFGLTWIAKMAVLEGLFLANFLAAVVGIALIATHRAERRTGLPFGFYLAVATALTIVWWS
jgi:leader peptidase (prepilin peptidase)/N-methyltransferase